MTTGNSESTAVANASPTPDSNQMECLLKTATPEALDHLAEILGKGLPLIDRRILTTITLLHGSKPDFREIIRSIDGTVKSCRHEIDDACHIINMVTTHVLESQNGITIKEWMEALRNYYLYCSDEFKLGFILSLLELGGSWDRRITQDFNDGLDDILIDLVNYICGRIPRRLLDEKYCGRLSNAIKRCFRHGDHSKIFTSINVEEANRVFEENFPLETESLSLAILEQINYAFFGSLHGAQEAARFIKRGLANPEPPETTLH